MTSGDDSQAPGNSADSRPNVFVGPDPAPVAMLSQDASDAFGDLIDGGPQDPRALLIVGGPRTGRSTMVYQALVHATSAGWWCRAYGAWSVNHPARLLGLISDLEFAQGASDARFNHIPATAVYGDLAARWAGSTDRLTALFTRLKSQNVPGAAIGFDMLDLPTSQVVPLTRALAEAGRRADLPVAMVTAGSRRVDHGASDIAELALTGVDWRSLTLAPADRQVVADILHGVAGFGGRPLDPAIADYVVALAEIGGREGAQMVGHVLFGQAVASGEPVINAAVLRASGAMLTQTLLERYGDAAFELRTLPLEDAGIEALEERVHQLFYPPDARIRRILSARWDADGHPAWFRLDDMREWQRPATFGILDLDLSRVLDDDPFPPVPVAPGLTAGDLRRFAWREVELLDQGDAPEWFAQLASLPDLKDRADGLVGLGFCRFLNGRLDSAEVLWAMAARIDSRATAQLDVIRGRSPREWRHDLAGLQRLPDVLGEDGPDPAFWLE